MSYSIVSDKDSQNDLFLLWCFKTLTNVLKVIILNPEVHLEPCQTSRINIFVSHRCLIGL